MCNIRRKLSPFGIKITTNWGRGYSLENRKQYLPETGHAPLGANLEQLADYRAQNRICELVALLNRGRAPHDLQVAA